MTELAKKHFGIDLKDEEEDMVQVIQNSDKLWTTPFETIPDVEPQPINEFEKKMLEGTKSVTELLESEKEEQPQKVDDKKEFIMMVKVVALHNLKKHPLSNPSTFSRDAKDEVTNEMRRIIEDEHPDAIRTDFNRICSTVLFAPGVDYTSYPIYAI